LRLFNALRQRERQARSAHRVHGLRQRPAAQSLRHEILALRDEQPRLAAVLSLVEPPQLPKAGISPACDRFAHGTKKAESCGSARRVIRSRKSQDPVAVTPRASLARSANRRNVSGSRTATSASIFRFSSMPLSRRPAISWL